MNVDTELADLRRHLDDLIDEFDTDLVRRYELRRPFRHEQLSAYRRARMAFGRWLRRLGIRRTRPPPPWVAALKQGYGGSGGDDRRMGTRGSGGFGDRGSSGREGSKDRESGAAVGGSQRRDHDTEQTVLIWAIGAEREAIRRACEAIEEQRADNRGSDLVLVTDVADFAFYSRLGWLVELVPKLPDPARDYAARKLRYLAWRYRDAPALPISVGMATDVSFRDLIAKARAKLGSASPA